MIVNKFGINLGCIFIIEIFPIGIRDHGQAYFLEGEEKEGVLDYLLSFW